MSNEYRDKHLIDATSSQEPDYQTHFDNPIRVPCWEEFVEKMAKRCNNQFDEDVDLDPTPF